MNFGCVWNCAKKKVPAIAGQRMIKHQIGRQISNGWVSTAQRTSWSRPTRYPLTSKSHQKTSWNHPVEPLSHSFKENPTRFGDVPWNLRHRKNLKDGWHWKPGRDVTNPLEISKNWLSWMFVHLWVASSYFSLQTEMVFFPRPDPRKSDIKVIITSNTERRSSPWIWLTQRKKAFEFVKDC